MKKNSQRVSEPSCLSSLCFLFFPANRYALFGSHGQGRSRANCRCPVAFAVRTYLLQEAPRWIVPKLLFPAVCLLATLLVVVVFNGRGCVLSCCQMFVIYSLLGRLNGIPNYGAKPATFCNTHWPEFSHFRRAGFYRI